MSTLVVIDMQHVFSDPESPWGSAGTSALVPGIARLVEAFGADTVFTRFVAPAEPEGAWRAYYADWPFALVPDEHPLYDLLPGLGHAGQPVVSLPTFSKWGAELAALVDGELVLCGVSTDCCVLSTALAAADAGVAVRVVADACSGMSDADHQRALDAMALYAPLITVTDSAAVLAERSAE